MAHPSVAPTSLTRTSDPEGTDCANLTRAHLNDVICQDAWLREAHFTGADLYCADLTGAKRDRAKFTNATLRQARLTGADLSGANFARADLSGADLSGARLTRASFADANLTNALWPAEEAIPAGWKLVAGTGPPVVDA